MFPCARNKIHVAETSAIESKTKELRSTHKTSVIAITEQEITGVKNGSKTTEVSTGVSLGVAKSSIFDERNPINTTNTTIVDGPEFSASKYVVSNISRVDLDEEKETVKKQHVSALTKLNSRHINLQANTCDHNADVASYTNEHSKTEEVEKSKIPVGSLDNVSTNSEAEKKKVIDHESISNMNKAFDNSDSFNESESIYSKVSSITEIKKTNSALTPNAINGINKSRILTDSGGVYLGTEETDPSRMIECTVQFNPQQDSENDGELQTIKTTQDKNIENIRGLSVTVDIHNTCEQGLPEISD